MPSLKWKPKVLNKFSENSEKTEKIVVALFAELFYKEISSSELNRVQPNSVVTECTRSKLGAKKEVTGG